MMTMIFDNWMWFGFGVGVTLCIILFFTDFARKDIMQKRIYDPMWLAWLGAVAYMFHNVEEYGIDVTGAHQSFVTLMRGMFGANISDWAFLGCNLPLVWFAGPVIAYICWKKNFKGMATGMALFELINGVSHVVQGARLGYNAGLISGLVIFVPIAIWTIYVVYCKKHLGWKHFGLTFLAGIIYHVLLILGCQLAVHNLLLGVPQGIYMTFDALLFVVLIYVINKSKLGEWK